MIDIASLYSLFIQNPDITTDSRNIRPGSVYVALRGEHFDGNTFAAQALEKGARIAIVDHADYYIDNRTVVVEDCLVTLQQLASFHRRKLGVPIIGITGTNGKTTTKELIKAVLSKRYRVLATQGNLNNHIGVPLTLLAMTPDTEIGVVEMGANHPLEIKQLCEIAEPDFGLITNIGKAHLEGFGGFQGVIRTKKELYDFIALSGGTVFFNADNQLLDNILKEMSLKTISYGIHTGTFCRGKVIGADPFLDVEIENVSGKIGLDTVRISTNLVGVYNFENVLAAASIGLFFDVSLEEAGKAIHDYKPSNNRSQLSQTAKNRLLLDCYNANPSSTEAAITNFAGLPGANKLIILGDMLELGDESEKEHLKILNQLVSFSGIKVILVGPVYKKLSGSFGFQSFYTDEELNGWIEQHPVEGHFILLKGSRGIHLERVVVHL
jgi:UDP-N-acetylmuramoyl-tripeptide--D-alanyl-D-alanine ligase